MFPSVPKTTKSGRMLATLGCARNELFFRKVMVLRAQMMPLGEKKIKKITRARSDYS